MAGTSPAMTARRELSPQSGHVVMAALVAATHVLLAALQRRKDVDGRNKSGHDAEG
jgi:hypothetical protein